MVLPTGGRKPGLPGQSRNELTDRILGLNAAVARGIPETSGAPGQAPAIGSDGTPRFFDPEVVYLSRLGVLPNTGDDLTSSLQSLITSHAGRRIRFDLPGVYKTGCLQVPNNTTLEGYGATLKHDGTGPAGAIITNASTPGENIAIIGLTLDCTSGHQNIYLKQVNGVRLHDVSVIGVLNNWACRIEECHNIRITNYTQDAGNTLGEDGLHFVGGSYIEISNVNIKSGDDCISFTFQDADLGTIDLEHVVVSNAVLESRAARPLCVNIHSDTTGRVMRHLRFSNITGVAVSDGGHTAPGISFSDATGGNRIEDLSLTGVTVDCSNIDTSGVGQGCYLLGVNRARLVDVKTVAATNYGFMVEDSTDVQMALCESYVPRGASGVGFRIDNSPDTHLIACRSVDPKSHHFWILNSNRATIMACSSDTATGTGQAVRLENASRCRVIGGYWDTGGSGILEAGTSDYNQIFFNDVTNIQTNNFVVLVGSNSTKGMNVGDTGISAYTTSNVTADRTFNANSTTTDELADVLGTLIADLQARGVIR